MKRLFLMLLGLCLIQTGQANWPERLQQQRQAFRDAWAGASGGDRTPIDQHAGLLGDYPLYPDLQAAWLRTQVGRISDDEIRQFLANHQQGSTTRNLRYRWARSLAERQRWQEYFDLYATHYRNTSDEQLQCQALTARLQLGDGASLRHDALAYWMHGHSRPDECDPVFDWLEQDQAITDTLRRERIALALEQRQFSLAAWLARSLDQADQEWVQRWRRMRHRPDDALKRSRQFTNTEADRELIVYGIRRLARRDPEKAAEAWQEYGDRFDFEPRQRQRIERDIAYSAAQNYLPDTIDRIVSLDPAAIDDKLLAWGVRAALREQDWAGVVRMLDSLSAEGKNQDQWRYWRARALEAQGETAGAEQIYKDLATRRGFFSFLAADRIEADYAYNHNPATADDAILARLEQEQGLVRAREMFFVDLHGHARSEWEGEIARLNRPEQAQSAILANRWGWHSVAISTAYKAGLRDDLTLRYPMAFRDVFEARTTELNLPTTWAFGIARSESLFMPDVASRAGALGIMQLMPETGRLTARQAQIRYRGRPTLLDPIQNIALGTFYLDKMYARFDDHQVLATAAYNAGPHRVARWLPEQRPLPSDIWVETVPYQETRNYLHRVLAADVIFHWRLTGQTRRLAAIMPPVPVSRN